MSQVTEYHTSAPIQPHAVTTTILTSGEHLLRINEVFHVERPVEVLNDEIRVNENQMIEDYIYPVRYKGEDYYLRKSKGTTELFQIEE
jgi:hypothetical protein